MNLSLSTPFPSHLTKTQLAVSYGTSSQPNNGLDTTVLTGHAITVINAFNLARNMARTFVGGQKLSGMGNILWLSDIHKR